MSRGSAAVIPYVDPTTPPVLTLTGPATRSEVAGLCDAVRALLKVTADRVVVCDVTGAGPPGLPVVDTLARLELAARRAGDTSGCAAPIPPYAPCSAWSASPSRWRGTPNSGNHRWVSRKKWNPVRRPSEISSTWIAQGA